MSSNRELLGRKACTPWGEGVVTSVTKGGYTVTHHDGVKITTTWGDDQSSIGEEGETVPTTYPELAGKYQAMLESIVINLRILADEYRLPPGAEVLLEDSLRTARRGDIIADCFHNADFSRIT